MLQELLHRRSLWLLILSFCPLVLTPCGLYLSAQEVANPNNDEETPEDKKERIAAERFLDLLKKKPRLGTAMDKVYGYHVSRGSLDQLVTSIEEQAEKEKSGNLWMVVGMFAMQRGQDSLAVASLEKAESLNPNDPLISYYLGKSLVLLGQVDNAAAAMGRAIDKKPAKADLLEISQDLGRVYQRTNRNEEALAVWKKLEANFPGDQQVQEEIANILAEEGAREAALERYDALAKSHKDKFRQIEMAIRGNQIRSEMGQRDVALANFESILQKVNPDSWLYRDVRRRIDEVFLQSNDYDGLVQYYRKWVAEHPDDIEAMMRAGRQLSIQRRSGEAQELFRQAIEKAPTNTEARQSLIDSLVSDNKVSQAIQEVTKLVEIDPDNMDRFLRWGELIMQDDSINISERRKQAAEVWKRMLNKRSKDAVTIARVADLHRGANLSEEAIGLYRNAIALADNEPQYREYLGEFLNQLGRKEEAMTIWEEIASGSRESRESCVRLSEIMKTFDYPAKAIAAMARACELNPAFEHRARFAELLRDDKQFDAALEQLDLAENLAEDKESREKLVAIRVNTYQVAGKLNERIEQQEKLIASELANNAAAWQLLAMLLEANGKFQEASLAIEKAISLDSSNINYSLAAARIQERSGQIGPAIETYRRLASIDRRFLSNYLTQIASLQMRLGQSEAALKTGRELIASAPGNSDNYRFFADLCFQVGDKNAGLDTLRRNLRNHPNDSEALTTLAKYLANELQTDEAIELNWRLFDLAKDAEAKSTPIGALTELYLRANRFETLIKRLDTLGREENKVRDATLWMAMAYQAAGDLGMAKSLLERLVRQDSRDTKLFEQLIALSKAEFDLEAAVEYQRRLNAISPTPQGEYALATLLSDLGQIDEAETLWMKLSTQDRKGQSIHSAVESLLGKQQYESAYKIIEKAMAQSPEKWELFAPGMTALYRLNKKDEVRQMANQVLQLNVPPETLSEFAKASLARAPKNAAPTKDAYSKATLLDQSRTMQQMAQLREQVFYDDDRYGGYYGGRSYEPTCFWDVQIMAKGVLFSILDSEEAKTAEANRRAAIAKESNKPEELWNAIYALIWTNPQQMYYNPEEESPSEFEALLKLLVAQGDKAAKQIRLDRLMNSSSIRRRADSSPAPIAPEKLEEAEKLIAELNTDQSRSSYQQLWLATQFQLAGKKEKADKIFEAIESGPDPHTLLQLANVVMASEKPDMDRAITLWRKSMELARKQTVPNQNQNQYNPYSQQNVQLLGQFAPKFTSDQWIEVLDLLIQDQVNSTMSMRPSQRTSLISNVYQNFYYVRNGNYTELQPSSFPPANGYLDFTLLYALKFAFEQPDVPEAEQQTNRQTIGKRIQAWATENTDDATLRIVRRIAWIAFASWDGKNDLAFATLEELRSNDPSNELFLLLGIRLLKELGKVSQALELVEKIRPSNQQMLVDRELTILQLALELGDVARARESAQRLFVLRLKPETEFKLCDLMYPLGLKEQADRMMERIQRRSGGKQDTLMLLMNRYSTSGDLKKAAEIALAILRRSSPRGNSRYSSQESAQGDAALRVLVQAGELKTLIEQTEEQLKRSPKSLKLANSLAAFYEAAGRREDANKLRMGTIRKASADPATSIQSAIALTSSGKHAEAVPLFLEAIKKQPDLLSQHYYEMQSCLTSAKAWSKLVDMIEEVGPNKFRNSSYRFQEMGEALNKAGDLNSAKRLFKIVVEKGDVQLFGYVCQWTNNSKFELNEEMKQSLLKRLTDNAFFTNTNQFQYVQSYSGNGQANNYLFQMLISLSKAEDTFNSLRTALEQRLEKQPKEILSRTMLAIILAGREKWPEFEAVIQPWKASIQEDNPPSELSQVIWCVASQVGAKPNQIQIMLPLLEWASQSTNTRNQGSQFQYTSGALLAIWYTKIDKADEAKKLLMKAYQDTKLDTRYSSNPGYAESRLIEERIQIATLLSSNGFPLDAYIISRRIQSDQKLIEQAKGWGGNTNYYMQQLDQNLAKTMTADTTFGLISQTLGASVPEPTSKEPGTSDKPKAIRFNESDIESLLRLEIAHTHSLDYSIEIPMSSLVDKLTKNASQKSRIKTALEQVNVGKLSDPKKIAWTYLVATAVGAKPTADACVERLKGLDLGPAEPSAEAQLPNELAFTLIATRMAKEGTENEIATRILEQSESIAKTIKQPELARSLRIKIAERVAKSEPTRSKALFQGVLDELLPVKNNSKE